MTENTQTYQAPTNGQQPVADSDGRRPVGEQLELPRGTTPRGSEHAFWLVIISVAVVATIFVVTMFQFTEAFRDDAAQVLSALTSVFAVIGTLTGAYFGIKASGDAREATESARRMAENSRRQTAEVANAALARLHPEAGAQALRDSANQGGSGENRPGNEGAGR